MLDIYTKFNTFHNTSLNAKPTETLTEARDRATGGRFANSGGNIDARILDQMIRTMNYYRSLAKYAGDVARDAMDYIRQVIPSMNHESDFGFLGPIPNQMSYKLGPMWNDAADALEKTMHDPNEVNNYLKAKYMSSSEYGSVFAADVCRKNVVPYIILSPEIVGGDKSDLSDFYGMLNVGNIYGYVNILIYGFKNLKNIDFNKLLGLTKRCQASISLFIVNCPKLADANIDLHLVKLSIIERQAGYIIPLLFLPDQTTRYTKMQLMRQLRLSVSLVKGNQYVYLEKNPSGTEFRGKDVDIPSAPSPTVKAKTATPVSVAPRGGDGGDDLPALINRDGKIYTVDGDAPIGRITRNGKNIYKMNQAIIWLIVGDDHICRTKKGVSLYRLV